MKLLKRRKEEGFTFVEIAIVAPIVILAIGAFITVIVSMTGEVLTSRASTTLLYSVQDALNRIDQDVKLSTTFLAKTSVTIVSPQGVNDGGSAFTNVDDGTVGSVLILNSLATTGNPLDPTSSVAYLNNSPNACGALQGQNTPLSTNVVYFIKNTTSPTTSTLWRRTIMPSGYASLACNNTGTGTAAPWQQPSCTTISGVTCKTQDEKLVEATTINISYQYFTTSSSTKPNTAAVANPTCNDDACVATRNSALTASTTLNATIDAHQTVAGKDVQQTGSIRSTRLDTNASAIASPIAPTIPSVPAVTASTPNINGVTDTSTNITQTTLSWPQSSGGGTITYSLRYKINGAGSWTTVNNIANSRSPSYTITSTTFRDTVEAQVQATNIAGSSSWSSSANMTVPIYASPILASGWTNYTSLSSSTNLPFTTAGFTRTTSGVVSLKGLLIPGSGTIMTLPVGFRPSERIIFPAISGGFVQGRIDVLPDGTVSFANGGTSYLSLDNIRFLAAPPDGPSFTSFTPNGSWTSYGSGYETPGYAIDASGRVHVKGLVKGGSTSTGYTIWSVPGTSPSLKPSEDSQVITPSNNAYGQLSVQNTDAGVDFWKGSNTWFMLHTMYYPATAPTGYPGATWTLVTPSGSWSNYSVYTKLAYTKGTDGIVMLKGMVSGGAIGSTIMTLPAGYRPSEETIMATAGNSALSRIDITPDGVVYLQNATSTTWLSLDGISFPAEK